MKKFVKAEILRDVQSYKLAAPGEEPVPEGPVHKKGTITYIMILREMDKWIVEERVTLIGGTIERLIPKDAVRIISNE